MLGQPRLDLETTTSTNDVARAWAQQGAADGALVVAGEQSAGRGRRGRAWLAPRGSSLLMSLVLRPPLPARQVARLTMLAAVAVVRSVAAFGVVAAIKWPNDVLVGGRKIAGILTEAAMMGDRLDDAIVGIGLNLNVRAGDVAALSPTATSLLAETGQVVSREQVLRLLLAELDVRYAALAQDGGLAILDEWRSLLETIGRDVSVTAGERTVRGRAEAVDDDGTLLLRQEDGTIVRITFGDVS